ncbi:TolC family outer membrane protein [Allosphingosinicella sp.]|uniref:TolC family outer membrane protein n=1 Tax=Allosphingosinicella sp. TaxID=2823234 RepID=UPI002FC0B4A3
MRSYLFLAASAALSIAGPLQAETLRQALVRAYQTNPALTGARAGLRAIDNGVPLAKAAGRPSLSGTADYQEFVQNSANSFTSPLRAATAGVNLNVPLYQGGRVRNSVSAAKARVEAGRASLRSTEAILFEEIVAAYLDVARDDVIVQLNMSNVNVLETNLQASRDRFEIGDLTLTDVAQSQARLALARGQLETARAQLVASRANYLRLVGVPPVNLQPPPALPGLPATPAQAIDIALDNNPQLETAKAESVAARYDIGVEKASRLPRLSAIANGGYANYLGTLGGNLPGRTFFQTQNTVTVGLSATIPLYQGGAPAARVRRANELYGQSLEQIILVERAVVADARAAFSRYNAALQVIRSAQVAVEANELAVEGVRAENTVGTRNVLDVLNAEQELLNSRVQLATARRDAYVAGFSLLAAIGKAEARDLGLFSEALYESGFGAGPAPEYQPAEQAIPPSSSLGDPDEQRGGAPDNMRPIALRNANRTSKPSARMIQRAR